MQDATEKVLEFPTALCAICQEIADVENPEVDKPCVQCKHFFCRNHASKVDPDYCDNCSRPSGISYTEEGLVDDEGNGHEGRKITLTGEFWMSMQKDLIQMSDSELNSHVNSLREAVREVELIRDYRKIALARGENELEDRQSARYRRLRLISKFSNGKISAKQITEIKKRQAKPKGVSAIFDSLKGLGLTREQIEAMIANAKGGVK